MAANISGARRRLYGTARDLVIGMKFATLEGKLVQSGGMVVKNVAGLDMGKLMIGSFGTLAAIASVNFKLTPRPAVARTLLFTFDDLQAAIEARDAAIRGVLNPVAVEMLNPVLSAQLGLKSFTLALVFAGNRPVIERSLREAAAFGAGARLARGRGTALLEFVARRHAALSREVPRGRGGARLDHARRMRRSARSVEGPGHAHAASGVVRGWFTRPEAAARWLAEAVKRGWKAVVEFSSDPPGPRSDALAASPAATLRS